MAEDTKIPETKRYFSKYASLVIAVKSAYYKTDPDGHKTLVDGNRVNFTDGFFETNDLDLQEKLEQRPDFGTAFVLIPKNKTVEKMREQAKANDVKERELAAREAELDAREKKIKAAEEGGGTGPVDTGSQLPEVNEGMKRDELESIAQAEGVAQTDIDAASNKAALVEVIVAKRAEGAAAGATGSFEE